MSSTSTVVVTAHKSIPLGLSVPPFTPHAISVSLPTWRDNVGYEEGDKRVVDSMVSGYPRFFIHLSIQKLARIFEQKYGTNSERCMLFATHRVADQCRSFMQTRSIHARLISLLICPEDKENGRIIERDTRSQQTDCTSTESANLHIVLFPSDAFPVAKEFWQHSGMGISSRRAEHCLSMLPEELTKSGTSSPTSSSSRFPVKKGNKHYSVKGSAHPVSPPLSPFASSPFQKSQVPEELDPDQNVYLEERYGRNLPLAFAASAKRALRRRVAGVLIRDIAFDCQGEPCAGDKNLVVGPSSRGVADVSENDVYLFPTGMAAIWNAHDIASSVRPAAKSVCFGFPYADSLKILQKWGPGCYFFGEGVDKEIDDLEALLEKESARDPTTPPILSLFTEFPSNPLLRSANLPRLRALADKYDFLIIIDETIGNFVNVEVLPYADIVVSSLSKIFSGASNVMGGSLVLNPRGRHYAELKAHMNSTFEDLYYDEDAIYMERNSRDFRSRIKVIDANTEAVCAFLRSRSLAGGAPSPVIKEVFYPKYITPENYEHCRIKAASPGEEGGGYGGLFSLTFTSLTASRVFFDALPCYKGPSLGTNFTLACPFTILAHYAELDWAAQYGVEEGLVRISMGMEETQALLQSFETALKAAEDAVFGS
ncbi:putative cystathionine gamma-synthase [Hypsizygus marmoreus]|uniref:cystathionine gamma-synthase n=1 Tax=Hypsizygus marmoreus TaxID=39966 RepID=A0A369K5C6_HYPMA|nr:putative cystathionine gamma-synthase [Hypsizygus marmoreus]